MTTRCCSGGVRQRPRLQLHFSHTLRILLALVSLVALTLVRSEQSGDEGGGSTQPQPQQQQRRILEAADGTSVQRIPLQGCWQMSFTAEATVGQQHFRLQVDTTNSALTVVTPACLDCKFVAPLYTPAAVRTDTPVAQTSWRAADGSGWWADVALESVSLIRGSGPLLPAVSMRIGAITDVQHGNGLFFPTGSCDDLGSDASAYQGILGMAHQTTASAAPTDSLLQVMRATKPAMGIPFALHLCERGGSLWLGDALAAAAAADDASNFRSMFAGPLLYTQLLGASDDLYALDIATIGTTTTTSPTITGVAGGGDSQPPSPTPSPEVSWSGCTNFSGRAVLDSSQGAWLLPGPVFRTLTRSINQHPLFARWFGGGGGGGGGQAFWRRSACRALPTDEATFETMQRLLPRIHLRTRDGMMLSLPALGSYIIPCDRERRTWGSGLRSNPLDANFDDVYRGDMRLGWSFLNHFMVQVDAERGRVGLATSVTKACGGGGTKDGDGGWSGWGTSGALVSKDGDSDSTGTGVAPPVCGTGGRCSDESNGAHRCDCASACSGEGANATSSSSSSCPSPWPAQPVCPPAAPSNSSSSSTQTPSPASSSASSQPTPPPSSSGARVRLDTSLPRSILPPLGDAGRPAAELVLRDRLLADMRDTVGLFPTRVQNDSFQFVIDDADRNKADAPAASASEQLSVQFTILPPRASSVNEAHPESDVASLLVRLQIIATLTASERATAASGGSLLVQSLRGVTFVPVHPCASTGKLPPVGRTCEDMDANEQVKPNPSSPDGDGTDDGGDGSAHPLTDDDDDGGAQELNVGVVVALVVSLSLSVLLVFLAVFACRRGCCTFVSVARAKAGKHAKLQQSDESESEASIADKARDAGDIEMQLPSSSSSSKQGKGKVSSTKKSPKSQPGMAPPSAEADQAEVGAQATSTRSADSKVSGAARFVHADDSSSGARDKLMGTEEEEEDEEVGRHQDGPSLASSAADPLTGTDAISASASLFASGALCASESPPLPLSPSRVVAAASPALPLPLSTFPPLVSASLHERELAEEDREQLEAL